METQDVELPKDYQEELERLSRLPHAAYVYFIYCAGRIKIGRAEDAPRRLSQIATSSPFKPVILLTVSGPKNYEKELHARFAEDRVHREWFALSDFLRRYLVRRLTPDGLAAFRKAEEDFIESILPPAAATGTRKWSKPKKRCHHRKPLSHSCPQCTREAALRVYDQLIRKMKEERA